MPADERSRALMHRAARTLPNVSRVRQALNPAGVDALVEAHFPPTWRIPTALVGKADRASLRQELRALLETGAHVLERLEQQGEDAPIEAAEQTALETVVAFFGRPALRVRNGSFGTPPVGWERLENHREGIEATIESTGRIELAGVGMLGTGFLVAEDVVMTNRHVAVAFSRERGAGWSLMLGVAPRIDWLGEHERDVQAVLSIQDVIAIHPEHDLALLRLGPARGQAPRTPLRLAATKPDTTAPRAVYTVGYPMKDHTNTPPEVLLRYFENVFGVKRLQPGELLSVDPDVKQLAHDCSTLGGSSGSPVVDLESNTVIGLHFGGTREQNRAVALWQLSDDVLLARAGVRFTDGAVR
ncbi:trypsin-like peptidase domain-containing protein [Pyxidicoccus fallax]|uniref:Trypsin-like peptidase domain-containing protein n=1 Tax=Pyxidicoccus fallax TaxID=394095 RepID=A0A848LU42_9BACT|nr:serine protease [Pyxidicoccus fallax]NMO21140.1 trypsin-like peptidase domain-containing protein [Pyxidicoccus fallax]NPC84326.1 trypsin-like peptidase domain-containing protein [Pyxidicoccus fallax]